MNKGRNKGSAYCRTSTDRGERGGIPDGDGSTTFVRLAAQDASLGYAEPTIHFKLVCSRCTALAAEFLHDLSLHPALA